MVQQRVRVVAYTCASFFSLLYFLHSLEASSFRLRPLPLSRPENFIRFSLFASIFLFSCCRPRNGTVTGEISRKATSISVPRSLLVLASFSKSTAVNCLGGIIQARRAEETQSDQGTGRNEGAGSKRHNQAVTRRPDQQHYARAARRTRSEVGCEGWWVTEG